MSNLTDIYANMFIKNKISLVESIKNNFNIQLDEAIKAAKFFNDILHAYGYKLPEESNYTMIDRHEKEIGKLLIKRMENDREKTYNIKIGKLLKDLFPDMDVEGDRTVQNMMQEIKTKLETMDKEVGFYFDVMDDVAQGYIDCYNDSKISSCFTGWDGEKIQSGLTNRMLDNFKKKNTVKCVVKRNKSDDKAVGRALLWTELDGLAKPLMDYPKGNGYHNEAQYFEWAREQGYYTLDSSEFDRYDKNYYYHYGLTAEEVEILPHFDTFTYAQEQDGELVLSNRRFPKGKYWYLESAEGNPLTPENLSESINLKPLKPLMEELSRTFVIPLNEAIDIAKRFENVLKKYGYTIPDESVIKAIRMTDEAGKFDIDEIKDNGKPRTMKGTGRIGGILTKLFPDMDVVSDPKVQKMINELRNLTNNIDFGADFEVSKDISGWYKKLYKDIELSSCVTNREHLLKGFDDDSNVSIVIIKNKNSGKPMGRALLWFNVEDKETGETVTYLDRTYPNNDDNINGMYHRWAEYNGYLYRDYQGYDDYSTISGQKRKLRFRFQKPAPEVGYMPYMDTFKSGYNSKKANILVITNYSTQNKEWWFETPSGMNLSFAQPEEEDNYDDDGGDEYYCSDCNNGYNDYDDGSTNTDSGNWTCNDCLHDNYHMCDHCDTFTYFDDVTTVNPNSVVLQDYIHTYHQMNICESCIDNYDDYTVCYKCEHVFENGYVKNIPTDNKDNFMSMCMTCIKKEGLEPCSGCNSLNYVNEMYFIKSPNYTEGGYHICDDCFENNTFKINNIDYPRYYKCDKCNELTDNYPGFTKRMKEDGETPERFCKDCMNEK